MVPRGSKLCEVNAVVARCRVCGWEKEYLDDVEGGHDYALASAVIETRLGHQAETVTQGNGTVKGHEVEYLDAYIIKRSR